MSVPDFENPANRAIRRVVTGHNAKGRSIVSEDGFVLGRATPNVGVGLMQVVAFAAGALLLRVLATTGLFLFAAALMLAATVLAWWVTRSAFGPDAAKSRP